jgi:hypothetical protein
MTAPSNRDCHELPSLNRVGDDELFVSTQPAIAANDNENWITTLSRSCETVASLEEPVSDGSLGGSGAVVLAAAVVAVSIVAIGWCYIIAASFGSVERLLN